ncbi:hypothetical protein LY28_02287 [Ruminiclostridium sufflavum DSM 19573]|uniref:Uncharacterized protein n=1 Tax=Ruminiclostridium sufflavum DSM 19573 TaxID=1121337 RepID=A0A318Y587_9FIRM|nr:hypothetical protein LY28_02287 [Ruminiclostridium sufflavum DSM 19573]
MSDEHCCYGEGLSLNGDLVCAMKKYIGQTVTIFTTSGGMSGCGFTGVLLGVNECFVKLITQIGPAPGCAIGNACSGTPYASGMGCMGGNSNMNNGNPIGTVGSVTDIPVCSIACFTHSAI